MRIVKAATSDGFKRRKKGQPSRRHPQPTLTCDEKRVAGEGETLTLPSPATKSVSQARGAKAAPIPAGDEMVSQEGARRDGSRHFPGVLRLIGPGDCTRQRVATRSRAHGRAPLRDVYDLWAITRWT